MAATKPATDPLGAEATTRRRAALRAALVREGLDAFVVLDRANTLHLTGFSGSNSATVVSASGDDVFLTDFRYLESARKNLRSLDVRAMTQDGHTELADTLKALGARHVGFEGSVSVTARDRLKKAAGRATLVEAGALPATLRAVKDAAEIARIARNQSRNEAMLKVALAAAQPGRTEIDVRRAILHAMIDKGYEEAFASIVAAGAGSSLPHAVPGRRTIRAGGYLLIDMGVKADHYHSDMTRTFATGRCSARHREVYEIVLAAQAAALAAIRPGAVARDVDAAARDIIVGAGHGDHYGHGLGHGVGLEIHEGPRLNQRSETVLEPGMVVTVEPGIYIPGFGGVRIEDLVVVTKTGYTNLTKAPKTWCRVPGT